jgi:hypothetical protein
VLTRGERRLEAETYLSDGYGKRLAIEARSNGWSPLRDVAHVWQPSRLKGIVVAPDHGVPFLSAGQLFEVRPAPRKWLALARTDQAADRFVEAGTILVSCSGTVGRVTMAYRPHLNVLITHDLLRVEPVDAALQGWIYAYMRTSGFRAMARAAHYGHVVKHLEPAHLAQLPILTLDPTEAVGFVKDVAKIFATRNQAHELVADADALYARAVGVDLSGTSLDTPFMRRASQLFDARRRFDAYHHNEITRRIVAAFRENAQRVVDLRAVTERIWWPGRFRRVFGDNGAPYLSAEELFNLNPPITKRVYAGLVENRGDYFLEPGWLVMARSGQIYGLNGSVCLVTARHARSFVSEDLIRIAPRPDLIRAGYLLAALGHPTLGRPLVIRHAYGTSIPHLEPADAATICIPRFDSGLENEIADRLEEAAQLRAEADDLEDQITDRAEQVMERFLHAGLNSTSRREATRS